MSGLIDWHSHVLPGIDDGSQTVEESIVLLKALSSQGVHTVVATPHYNADQESVESFLQRRSESLRNLSKGFCSENLKILLGAEVRYYPGISRLEEIGKLKIEGSRLLLLEMPRSKWTEYTLRELEELSGSGDTIPILAHIERYLSFQTDSILHRLYECGILMQVNAPFFTGFFTRKKALRLLGESKIHLVGSDCHNMIGRPPMLDQAFQCIEKRFGTDFICQMNEFGSSMLVQNSNIFDS